MFPMSWYNIQSSNKEGGTITHRLSIFRLIFTLDFIYYNPFQGFYELQTISSSANKFSQLETKIKEITSAQGNDSVKLIGIWKTEHGPLDTSKTYYPIFFYCGLS